MQAHHMLGRGRFPLNLLVGGPAHPAGPSRPTTFFCLRKLPRRRPLTASASQALLGTSDWLNYYTLNGPAAPAGWTLVSVPIAIAGTIVVTGIGLAGLALRRIPERFYLVLLAVSRDGAAAAGYGGEMGGVLGPAVRSLIDGPAAAFRNVSKFEPLVALPIVMGLVHILGMPWLRRPPADWARRFPELPPLWGWRSSPPPSSFQRHSSATNFPLVFSFRRIGRPWPTGSSASCRQRNIVAAPWSLGPGI